MGKAWHDKALDFHGPVDFAEHARAQGAQVNIDPKTGKVKVVTGKGHAQLPSGPLYSYTEKRSAVEFLKIIGIVFLLVFLFAIPFLCR